MALALAYFERVLQWTLRQHFRIPPAAFWSALLFGTASAFFVPFPLAWASLGLATLGLIGVARWRHFRRPVTLLALPRPATVVANDGLALRAQELILESLRGRLTADEFALVRPIPMSVGPTDVGVADSIRRRLGAAFTVVGRVDSRADGGWSLFSGLVKAPEKEVIHLDFHTRDRTPARAQWAVALDYFSPTRDVQDVQDPLLVSREIEALVRSLAGHVAALHNDLERAVDELRAAIEASGGSDSWPIDELRCELARVLIEQDRHQDALVLLRERAARPDPSPELLRWVARLLGRQPGAFDEHLERPEAETQHAEAVEALRRAAGVRHDPKRAMTLYNLSALLGSTDSAEADRLLDEAMAMSRFYRQAWYTHRSLGASRYYAALERRDAGDEAGARELFAQAARHYSRAIRRRPKLRIWWLAPEGKRWLLVRFRGSPILHANAQDGYDGAGLRLRFRWHRWRAERLRATHTRRGNKHLAERRWLAGYASYDFAVIGRRDFLEAYAQVMRSVCLQQEGHTHEAAADFAEADERFPDLALILRLGAAAEGSLPRGLPGNWPSEEEGVHEILRERGFMSPSD